MKPTAITFSDIQTSELLYYDANIANDCLRFCEDRDIDCLPSLFDPLKYFKKTNNSFFEDDVISERRVEKEEYIFNKSLLSKFQNYSLLFVYSQGDLTGVVHFSDYNRPQVNLFLFDLLTSYERSLRKLLVLSGLNNQNMLDFFSHEVDTAKKENTKSFYKGKADDFEKHRYRYNSLPVFEKFYLKDLMELASYQKIIKVDHCINDLRNEIMHAHDLVLMQDANRDDYIYDFKSFDKFFKQVIILLQDYKRVNNRISFFELSRR